jgi:hypothetical protein
VSLSNTELIGLTVLTAPLSLVLVSLLYRGIRTGLEDYRRKARENKMKERLRKYVNEDLEFRRYFEELRALKRVEIGDAPVSFVKWLNRVFILPFFLLSYEVFRTLGRFLENGSPFIPHAVSIMLLSLLNVAVSTYYGFFIRFE